METGGRETLITEALILSQGPCIFQKVASPEGKAHPTVTSSSQ